MSPRRIQTVIRFLIDCMWNSLSYAFVFGICFGILGALFWIADGDPTGVLALGSFGAVFGALWGIGQVVIDRFNGDALILRSALEINSLDVSESGSDDAEKEFIIASVWPKANAQPLDLIMLGERLRTWQSAHPSVTLITGLESLINGHYPPPDGPTPVIDDPDGAPFPVPVDCDGKINMEWRNVSIPEPWKWCPALVWSTNELSSNAAIASLREYIPDELGAVGYSMPW